MDNEDYTPEKFAEILQRIVQAPHQKQITEQEYIIQRRLIVDGVA